MLGLAASNDLVEGYNKILDEFEMKWEGSSADNPFHRRVDIFVEFSDEPVRFLSITDEEESIIEPFLKSQPISG